MFENLSETDLLAKAAAERPFISPQLFSALQRSNLVDLLDRMQKEGLTAEQVIAARDAARAETSALRQQHEEACTRECDALREKLRTDWVASKNAATVDATFGMMERSRRVVQSGWVGGLHRTPEVDLRIRLAEAEFQERYQQCIELGHRLLASLPVRAEVRLARYYGNLSERHTNFDGALHLLLEEPFVLGRLKREAGQTLSGKREPDFDDLCAVDEEDLRRTCFAVDDMRIAERLVAAAREGKLQRPATPPARKI